MANETSNKIGFMPMLWVKVWGFVRNIPIGLVCGVLLFSVIFTALPRDIFVDLRRIDWYWGVPRYAYVVEHSIDGDWRGFVWNYLEFDLLFWFFYFSLLGFVAGMIWRKIGLRIRPFYSLCIIGFLTGILYAYLYRPDRFINAATGGYLKCFESRREQFDMAMRFGDLEAAQTLIQKNPGLVINRDGMGRTPLYRAAYYGQYQIVKLLLADGADPHSKDRDNRTPLFESALGGYLRVTELLLSNGAEANVKDDFGDTPLFCAAEGGSCDVVKLLLEHQANPNAGNSEGYTPLHQAAVYGHTSTVQLLIASNSEVNVKSVDGETPLYLAATMGHKDTVELLLANKAEVNVTEKSGGATPLQSALDNGYTNIVELLRQHGAR